MRNIEKLELITKGFASKRRIAILNLLSKQPGLDVEAVSERLDLGYKAVSEHLRKLHIAELIEKEEDGYYILHTLTPRGKQVVNFLSRLR